MLSLFLGCRHHDVTKLLFLCTCKLKKYMHTTADWIHKQNMCTCLLIDRTSLDLGIESYLICQLEPNKLFLLSWPMVVARYFENISIYNIILPLQDSWRSCGRCSCKRVPVVLLEPWAWVLSLDEVRLVWRPMVLPSTEVYIVGCCGIVQLGGLIPGLCQKIPLRLRIVTLFYILKVPLKLK